MHQVDPMSDKYSSLSTYHYSLNNPVSHNDPNGADSDSGGHNAYALAAVTAYFAELHEALALLQTPIGRTADGNGGGGSVNRELGESMYYGSLPYSQAYKNQWARDFFSMTGDQFSSKYSQPFTGRIAAMNANGGWYADVRGGRVIGSVRWKYLFPMPQKGNYLANSTRSVHGPNNGGIWQKMVVAQ